MCESEWVSVSEGVCVSVHSVVCVCEGLARVCVVGGVGLSVNAAVHARVRLVHGL